MALEQLSREEILLIEGREEGREEGKANKIVQFVEHVAKELGSIEAACKLLGVEVEEYHSCKKLQMEMTVYS